MTMRARLPRVSSSWAAIKSAAPRPAFSIRSRLGTWHASLAWASKRRISLRESTGIMLPAYCDSGLEHDDRGRHPRVMGDRDDNPLHPESIGVRARRPEELELRCAARVRPDFHVVPPHVGVAAECFGPRFFGGKASRQRGGAIGAALQIGALVFSQDTLPKPITETREGRPLPLDGRDVDAQADDHRTQGRGLRRAS